MSVCVSVCVPVSACRVLQQYDDACSHGNAPKDEEPARPNDFSAWYEEMTGKGGSAYCFSPGSRVGASLAELPE